MIDTLGWIVISYVWGVIIGYYYWDKKKSNIGK